jgi:hypothetical protein
MFADAALPPAFCLRLRVQLLLLRSSLFASFALVSFEYFTKPPLFFFLFVVSFSVLISELSSDGS